MYLVKLKVQYDFRLKEEKKVPNLELKMLFTQKSLPSHLTSKPFGVVFDGAENGALLPQASVDDGVAGLEVGHRG